MRQKWTIISLAVIMIVGAITYLGALPAPFIFDDHTYIVDNSFIKDPANLIHLFSDRYFDGIKKRWRPASAAVYFFSYRIWGLNPLGHRIIKILLHLLNGGLVFLLLRKITGKATPSLFAALFFLTHPVNAEAVNCIAFNDDLLAVFFLLVSLISARDYYRTRRQGRLFLCLGAYLCGLFSKETALLFLPGLILMNHSFPVSLVKEEKRRALPIAAAILTGIYCILRFGIFSWPGVALVSPPGWGERFLLGARALLQYFRFLVIPLDRPCLDYVSPLPFFFFRSSPLTVMVMGMTGALMILRMIRSSRSLVFAVGWICLALAPALHILPLPVLLADRYCYPAVIGWSFLLALAIFPHSTVHRNNYGRQKAGIVIAALLVVLFALLTGIKNQIWRDREKLWTSTIGVATDSAIAYNNRGWHYLSEEKGEKAAADFLRAIEINGSAPTSASALVNLATVYERRGENEDALKLASRARRRLPGYTRALRLEGGIYLRRKKYRLAARKFLEAIRRDRYDYRSYNLLGCLLAEIGSEKEAEVYLQKAVNLNPDAAAPRENLERLKTAIRAR